MYCMHTARALIVMPRCRSSSISSSIWSFISRLLTVPVNSIKGALGHTMGAAATLEALMCLLATRHGTVPHTAGLEEPDADCRLDHVRAAARAARPRVSLSTSLGFGGCNAALVLAGDAP